LVIAGLFAKIALAQMNHSQGKTTLQKIRLKISTDILAEDVPPTDYYITLNYDFEDSISILVNRKEVFKRKLDYVPMDSNQTSYPYNRILIKIADGIKDKKNISGGTCKLIFWKSRKYIEFYLKKSVHYYDVGATKDKDSWSLAFLNVLPWP